MPTVTGPDDGPNDMNRTTTARFDRMRDPLVVALCLSLSLHFLFYGIYRAGNAFGWWDVSVPFLQNLLQKMNVAIVDPEKIAEALRQQQELAEQEMPMMFVDVMPDQASTEVPENAKYYGALNSQAANTDADASSDIPKIDGEQEQIVKTVDVAQNSIQTPVVPVPPAEEAVEEEQEVINPDELHPAPAEQPEEKTGEETPAEIAEADVEKPGSPNKLEIPQPTTPKPGDLAFHEVRPQPVKGDGAPEQGKPETVEKPKPRPRTLAQARKELPQTASIAGEKMKQEGGVDRRNLVPSMDTLGTPFGVYDSWFIAQVQTRWFFLLEQNSYAYNWAGHVKVSFRLYYDGRVTDFKFDENNSGEIQGLLCQKAVIDNVPYRQWPTDLRRLVDKDYRELRFTFYYN